MPDLNRVILLGRVGNDLELKQSSQGHPYLKMSLATHSFRADTPRTHWHHVVVFGPSAEACSKYLTKGSEVLVEGSLEVKTFSDSSTSKTVRKVSVIANRVHFIGSRVSADVSDGAGDEQGSKAQPSPPESSSAVVA